MKKNSIIQTKIQKKASTIEQIEGKKKYQVLKSNRGTGSFNKNKMSNSEKKSGICSNSEAL